MKGVKEYGYIYLTTNLINGKVYVGKHQSPVYDAKYYGSGKNISDAIKKYGIENFSNEILCSAASPSELNELEKEYIALYKAQYKEKCYNIASGGEGGDIYGQMSEENQESFRNKMTAINRKRCTTKEFRAALSIAGKRRYSSIEEREKQSIKIREAWSNKALRSKQSQKLKNYYSTHKKDNSYNYKPCIFVLDGKQIHFESVAALRKFLKENYSYNPDRRTFKKLMDEGGRGIPFAPLHKNKLQHLQGMRIYYEQNEECRD